MRIAIVNANPATAAVLQRILVDAGHHQVAWVTHTAAHAVAQAASDIPDLLLMDLLRPSAHGVEAIRQITEQSRCPILIVAETVDRRPGDVYEALGAGALDAVALPTGGPAETWSGTADLLEKIATIDRTFGSARKVSSSHAPRPTALSPNGAGRAVSLVGVGASAGGPTAIATILAKLPRDFGGAIVIIQHLDPLFVHGMVAWLSDQSVIPVRLASAGDRPTPGVALVAGGDGHLVLGRGGALRYSVRPNDPEMCPSIDVFFESIVAHWRGDAVGVVLTGMGRDGASGLRALSEFGATTIVQDQATSAVYGMPKAAAELNATSAILPLRSIAPRLVGLCGVMHSSPTG